MADKPDLHDHTLVWMSHPDCEEAAMWPRSFLAYVPDSGWKELDEPNKSPKVQSARSANPAVESDAAAVSEEKK